MKYPKGPKDVSLSGLLLAKIVHSGTIAGLHTALSVGRATHSIALSHAHRVHSKRDCSRAA